ncbi:MAG: hypothetical protein ABI675_13090 [Chitinophagaceae bacterium]
MEIEDKTSVVLSITTLKRLWGKVKYGHSPTLTTLNTLARFLDYNDWRSFIKDINTCKQEIPDAKSEIIAERNDNDKKNKFKISIPFSAASVLIFFAITFMIFSVRKDSEAHRIDIASYHFKADKIISEGVPNSVVFTYDASAANTDSIFIIQTWDIKRKTLISKNNDKHSAIYYYPGFFRTKLIIDNTVVKSHDLQITSNGWLCLAENEPAPIYFKKEEYQKSDKIEIDRDVLKKYNFSLSPIPPKIRFFNQRDMGDLMNDNFNFETTLKNEFNEGSNACQYVEVLIQCKDDVIIIPLAARACAGKMYLYAAGKELKSEEADLSGFGADLNQWTTLRIEAKDKKMIFYVNNIGAASFVFPNSPSGIVGVQYRFNGVGAVRNTWFETKSRRIVMD